MNPPVADYLLYLGRLFLLTLGTPMACGLLVGIFSHLVSRLLGGRSGRVFDVTSVIGTPVHELGHALMCPIFGHRIRRMLLWTPRPDDGVYGYVEHSYNRKNPWARLGCLFIGLGPIFSGLAVTVLMLWICFPEQWNAYLSFSRELTAANTDLGVLIQGILSLFQSILSGFGNDWLRRIVGMLVILPVSLHISLSWQDIKSSAGAIPLYLLIIILFGIATMAAGVSATVLSWLWLWNIQALSLFCIVIAFSAVWVILALLVRAARIVIGWF
jgi:hypothetical protein